MPRLINIIKITADYHYQGTIFPDDGGCDRTASQHHYGPAADLLVSFSDFMLQDVVLFPV